MTALAIPSSSSTSHHSGSHRPRPSVAPHRSGPPTRAFDRPNSPAAHPLGAEAGITSWCPVLDGRYVLLGEIGRGMSVVHAAWDMVTASRVALKSMRPDLADSYLLAQEASIAMRLTHETILRVHHYEHRRDRGGPFLVMELVPWGTGQHWMAAAAGAELPTEGVVAIGLQLCEALAYAHARGVLHLDIKPANVFVDPAWERVKLADFGLARVMAEHRRALQLTPAGTPGFMAPEQWIPGGKVSPATDVYLLAATLWSFLTGDPSGPSPEMLAAQVSSEPKRARILNQLREVLTASAEARPADATSFGLLLQEAAA